MANAHVTPPNLKTAVANTASTCPMGGLSVRQHIFDGNWRDLAIALWIAVSISTRALVHPFRNGDLFFLRASFFFRRQI